MQLQRIQSVYIFLAIVAMAIFIVVPYGQVEVLTDGSVTYERLYTWAEYGILIPTAAVVILLLVDLFLFRNLPLQRTVLVVSLMITLATVATVCFTLLGVIRNEGLDAHFSVWDILPVAAALFEILGIKGIMHDIKLLNSYNRLR